MATNQFVVVTNGSPKDVSERALFRAKSQLLHPHALFEQEQKIQGRWLGFFRRPVCKAWAMERRQDVIEVERGN